MPSVILATASYDHTIKLWEATNGQCLRTMQHPDSQVNRLEITPDKLNIAAAGNPHVRFYDLQGSNPGPITNYDGHTSNITALGFQRDGRWMFTGSEDNTIKIWDLRAAGCQRQLTCNAAINSVCLHPNQVELIFGDQNGKVGVYDLTRNAVAKEEIPQGETAIRSVSVTPDASFAVAANNKGNCFIWKIGGGTTFNMHQTIEQAHPKYILKCLFSPDSRSFATTSADHCVKIWNLGKSGKFDSHRALHGHQRWVWDCTFSADSAFLVTASSDQTARLWDLSQGDTIRHYIGHSKAASCVALRDY
eukprot:TRINITY_DN3161_c0_g1_i1.p1 TRINITY_DN3161_c0_g1~~TRINITY_DN3161_c0_g1_i1.p1  ORF type:complete len:305 (-),score=139.91 TRINITY_DN3161_c0_g1_i1:171-1085(-)